MEVWGVLAVGGGGEPCRLSLRRELCNPPPPPDPFSAFACQPGTRRALTESQSLQTTAEHSCAFIAPPSIHFLFYIFYLNSLLHSRLNLFQSGAVETDLQFAAELYLGGVASCPVHMPTREARGRELSIKSPLQTCGRSRNDRQKKITNKRADCADQEVHV